MFTFCGSYWGVDDAAEQWSVGNGSCWMLQTKYLCKQLGMVTLNKWKYRLPEIGFNNKWTLLFTLKCSKQKVTLLTSSIICFTIASDMLVLCPQSKLHGHLLLCWTAKYKHLMIWTTIEQGCCSHQSKFLLNYVHQLVANSVYLVFSVGQVMFGSFIKAYLLRTSTFPISIHLIHCRKSTD